MTMLCSDVNVTHPRRRDSSRKCDLGTNKVIQNALGSGTKTGAQFRRFSVLNPKHLSSMSHSLRMPKGSYTPEKMGEASAHTLDIAAATHSTGVLVRAQRVHQAVFDLEFCT